MVRPPERSVWPWKRLLDVEVVVWFRERDAAQGCIVGEVTQGFGFRDGETAGRVEVIGGFEVGFIDGEHAVWGVQIWNGFRPARGRFKIQSHQPWSS